MAQPGARKTETSSEPKLFINLYFDGVSRTKLGFAFTSDPTLIEYYEEDPEGFKDFVSLELTYSEGKKENPKTLSELRKLKNK